MNGGAISFFFFENYYLSFGKKFTTYYINLCVVFIYCKLFGSYKQPIINLLVSTKRR